MDFFLMLLRIASLTIFCSSFEQLCDVGCVIDCRLRELLGTRAKFVRPVSGLSIAEDIICGQSR